MVVLRRHRLVRLTPAGWQRVLERSWPPAARACLAHWAGSDLPLVVARQPAPRRESPPIAAGGDAPDVHLGLPAPTCWERQRIALRVAASELRAHRAGFPALREVAPRLPDAARAACRALADALAAQRVDARVYGSFGWERITGLGYRHARSDLDLLLPVDDAAHADAVVACIARAAIEAPRLDGELVFGDAGAVAWREWQAWRARRGAQVLVKRLDGVVLASDAHWIACAAETAS